MISLPSALSVTRRFAFAAEQVFDGWLDPAVAGKWLFATPDGQMVRTEIEPRVGGRFTLTDRRHGQEIEHTGEYLEIQRPTRLAFSFGVPKFSPDFVRVLVSISSQPEGCELTLVQEGTDPKWITRTADGWSQLLESLAAVLGERRATINRESGRFTAPGEMHLIRLLSAPLSRVWEYLTESGHRQKWFAAGSMELRVGGKVNLLFRHADISPNEIPPEKYRAVHDPGLAMIGRITQCEPPHLLGFTWEGEPEEESSEVVFVLTSQGEETQVEVTHRRLGSAEECTDICAGWHVHLAILDALLAGGTPPPFWASQQRLEAAYAKRLEKPAPDCLH